MAQYNVFGPTSTHRVRRHLEHCCCTGKSERRKKKPSLQNHPLRSESKRITTIMIPACCSSYVISTRVRQNKPTRRGVFDPNFRRAALVNNICFGSLLACAHRRTPAVFIGFPPSRVIRPQPSSSCPQFGLININIITYRPMRRPQRVIC